MKSAILKSSLVCLTVLGASYASAGQTNMPKYLENQLVNICESIQENNVTQLKRAVRDAGISYRALEEGLKCNSMDMTSFAVVNKADKTGVFIAQKTNQDPKEVLARIDNLDSVIVAATE